MTTKQINEVLRGPIAELGFRPRRAGVFTIETRDGFLGHLAFGMGTRNYPVGVGSVIPYVGVRYQQMERIMADLRGEKVHNYSPPTISTPLRYLPDEPGPGWVIDVAEPSKTVASITDALTSYGLEFIHQNAGLTQIIDFLQTAPHLPRNFFRLPLALELAGRRDEANGKIREMVQADTPGLLGPEIVSFANAFEQWLGSNQKK